MATKRIIGVTGGIGSGKTSICRIFEILGYPVYNSDQRAREIVNEDETVRKRIIEEFGPGSYLSDHTLDRKKIANLTFNSPEKLKKLNSIVHPAVGIDFENWVATQSGAPFLIKESALLFETGIHKDLFKTLVIYAPEKIRLERVIKRDPHRSREDVQKIMNNQIDPEEARRKADFVVENDGQKMVIPQVLGIAGQLEDLIS